MRVEALHQDHLRGFLKYSFVFFLSGFGIELGIWAFFPRACEMILVQLGLQSNIWEPLCAKRGSRHGDISCLSFFFFFLT